MSDNIFVYAYGEYATRPLYFFDAGRLSDTEKINILKAFEGWYEDTDQDTEEWVFEFQILTRYILSEKIILNPKYLEIKDCIEELLKVIPGDIKTRYYAEWLRTNYDCVK